MPAWKKPKNPITNKDMEFDPADAMPVGPLVAAVSPTMIPGLKQRGVETLQKALSNPNFSPDIKAALTAAQERWPRNFGHLTGVNELGKRDGWKGTLDGLLNKVFGPNYGLGDLGAHTSTKGSKLGRISIKPDLTGEQAWNTVGHELNHGAQVISLPNQFQKAYKHLEDILGYKGNPLEGGSVKAGTKHGARMKHGK